MLRRLLLAHASPEAAMRNLRGCVVVAEHDFGMGSNRASAVRALLYAGVVAVDEASPAMTDRTDAARCQGQSRTGGTNAHAYGPTGTRLGVRAVVQRCR